MSGFAFISSLFITVIYTFAFITNFHAAEWYDFMVLFVAVLIVFSHIKDVYSLED
jgi:hypothetical protein